MHADHTAFIAAIHSLSKLRLTFFSKEDSTQLVRTCAPFDFGPRRRAKDQSDCYHFWDYDSDTKNHVLSLLPDQVISMNTLAESFDPADIVTWSPIRWFVQRNWGRYS